MDNAKEFLNFYNSGNLVFYTSMRLFATKEANWSIYADKDGYLYYIANFGTGCKSGGFGDCYHVKHLIKQGYFNPTQLTAYGRNLMIEKAGFLGN